MIDNINNNVKEYKITVFAGTNTKSWGAVYSLSKNKFIKNKIKKDGAEYRHTYYLMPGKYLLFSGDRWSKRIPKFIISLHFLNVTEQGITVEKPFATVEFNDDTELEQFKLPAPLLDFIKGRPGYHNDTDVYDQAYTQESTQQLLKLKGTYSLVVETS